MMTFHPNGKPRGVWRNCGRCINSGTGDICFAGDQIEGLLVLMDKLGKEGVVKFARALEQDEVIEGEYRDVGAGPSG